MLLRYYPLRYVSIIAEEIGVIEIRVLLTCSPPLKIPTRACLGILFKIKARVDTAFIASGRIS